MRLFVAVDLPAELKNLVATALPAVRGRFPRARWVRPELLHLTIAFLGEVAEAALPRLRGALREELERSEAFAGAVFGVGVFPPSGRVRILWLGLEPSERFARLAERARSALAAAQFPFDSKPFRPHVTLARCDPPWPVRCREQIAAGISPLTAVVQRREFGVERVGLYASALGRSGPSYRCEFEVVLRADESSSGAAGGTA